MTPAILTKTVGKASKAAVKNALKIVEKLCI